MSHASIPERLRDRLAPPADLVRLSVGIEDVDDIIDDLQQAFVSATGDHSHDQLEENAMGRATC